MRNYIIIIGCFSLYAMLGSLPIKEKQTRIFRRPLFILFSILLILFAGFRYGIDTDYWAYYNMFYTGDGVNDIGFKILINAFKAFIGNDFNIFILFIAIFSVGTKVLILSQYRNPELAIFLYFSFFYVLLEWNVIRQGIAISLLLFSIKYANDRKPVLFFIFVLLASTIHPISIVFTLFYFLYDKRISIKCAYLMIFGCLFIRIAMFPLLTKLTELMHVYFTEGIMRVVSGHLSYYFSQGVNRFITFAFVRKLITLTLFWAIVKKTHIRNIYFNGYFLGILIYTLLMGNETLSVRSSLIFDVLLIPLFADLDCKLNERHLPYVFTMVLMGMLIFLYSIQNSASLPYQSYLF